MSRRIALALCAVLTVAVGMAAQPAPERILVVPFDNAGNDVRISWLGEASAVLLTDELHAVGRRAYSREERLDVFEQLQVPPTVSLSRATVIRLGQRIGATHIVIGSFHQTAGSLIVRVHSIGLDSGRMDTEVIESGPLEDLFAVFERVWMRVAGLRANASRAARPALPVFENYVKGLLAAAPANVTYLQAALKLDPGFDRARLALWAVHQDQGNAQVALLAAAAVPETSPSYSRARFSVALSLIQLKRLDDAFATLRTLGDRAPSATVMNNIGVIQMQRPVTPQTGRATYYFNQAVKLDQDDPDYCFNLGYAYWVEQDALSAVFWLREAVRRNPADGDAHAVLGAALQLTGAAPEAGRERELAAQLSGGEPASRGLARLKTSLDAPPLRPTDNALVRAAAHITLAQAYIQVKDEGRALAELERALALTPDSADAKELMGRLTP